MCVGFVPIYAEGFSALKHRVPYFAVMYDVLVLLLHSRPNIRYQSTRFELIKFL